MVKIDSEQIMNAMVRHSKDWLRAIHLEDSRKRSRVQTFFPSVREILGKIKNYCATISLNIFDMPLKLEKIPSKTKSTIALASEIAPKTKDPSILANKSHALTKTRTMPRALAKWDDDGEL